jgi:hypothetical protein
MEQKVDRGSFLWTNIKKQMYPAGLVRGKEGAEKRQQLDAIDAEYLKVLEDMVRIRGCDDCDDLFATRKALYASVIRSHCVVSQNPKTNAPKNTAPPQKLQEPAQRSTLKAVKVRTCCNYL